MSRVFLDHNGNGVFDDGDAPMEGVRLEIDRGIQRNKTDADGFVYISSVTPNRNLMVKLDADSLGDPFLVPSKKGVSIVAYPGSTARVDFPVVTTGEIDGTVFKVEGTKVFPVSGAEVQMLDAEGNVVRELRSAFDGFYLMEFVPPGAYSLRINPEQLTKLGLVTEGVRRATIEGDGTVISGQDFVLRAQGTDAPTDAPAPRPVPAQAPDPADLPPPPAAVPVVPVTPAPPQ